MGNIVKLVFQAVATGSGLSKMYGEVKGLAKAMPGLTQAATILGGAFGSVGASFGRMATLLLQGPAKPRHQRPTAWRDVSNHRCT